MYIRASSQVDKKTKQSYTTYRLVESYRNQEGKVRQRTLINLGCHFNFPKKSWKLIADRVEDICRGQHAFIPVEKEIEKEAQRIAKLVTKKFSTAQTELATKANNSRDLQTVDVNSLEHNDIRRIGCEHVGYHAVKQLHLEDTLRSLSLNQKQIETAIGSIIGRLAHPGSELSTYCYLTEQSALDELLGTDFSNLHLKRLYRVSDILLSNKEAIEAALYRREKDLFNLNEIVTLYDITNTYFEGRCLSNPKAQYGHSKEKRNDCCLVSLGMVLDSSGFPKKSKIFPGNVSEPKTIEKMLSSLGSSSNATIVMDAGFASEENIAWLKESKYEYIVVSRKRSLMLPENADTVIVKESTNNLVQVSLVKNEVTDELELYCHSQAKEQKTKQMVSKFCSRYECELQKLAEGLTKKGHAKKYEKIVEKLGRLKERYSKVGKLYNVTVKADKKGKNAIEITWVKNDNLEQGNSPGIYCLRTNRKDLDENTFWEIYTMLTELEAAFRSLKSELGFRPVYHHKEKRVDGHLFISIIAYHILHTIRYQLKTHGINASWKTIRDLLSTQCRITSTMQLENGKVVKIRKTSSPDTNQLMIYKALNISTHPVKTGKTYF
jgi:transposase